MEATFTLTEKEERILTWIVHNGTCEGISSALSISCLDCPITPSMHCCLNFSEPASFILKNKKKPEVPHPDELVNLLRRVATNMKKKEKSLENHILYLTKQISESEFNAKEKSCALLQRNAVDIDTLKRHIQSLMSILSSITIDDLSTYLNCSHELIEQACDGLYPND